MYFDAVIIASCVVVALTCAILGYIGIYAYKHIQKEIAVSASDVQKR